MVSALFSFLSLLVLSLLCASFFVVGYAYPLLRKQKGWAFLGLGLGFILLGSLLAFTGEIHLFEISPLHLVFFEKFMGHTFGFICLFIGGWFLCPQLNILLQNARHKKAEESAAENEKPTITASVEKGVVEHITAFKNHFYQNIDQEFRQPMSAMLNISEVLLNDELSGEQVLRAQVMHHSAHCMVHSLNGMTMVSEMNQSKFVLGHTPFEMKKMLSHALASVRQQSLIKNVNLRVKLAQGLPEYLVGDQLRLRYALLSLIGNMLDHTIEGDVLLTITASNIQKNRAKLYFKVENSQNKGNTDDIHKAFETAAERGDNKLALVQNIVKTMNGACGAEATRTGALLWIRIPCEITTKKAYMQQRASINKPSVDKNFMPLKVLVIDDEKMQLVQAEMLLKKIGVGEVDTCSSGKDALMKAASKNYDMILMDCQMPDMDGFETTNQLRKQDKTSTVPIIAHTPYLSENVQDNCYAVGMNDFISKPCNKEDYKNMLRKWALKGGGQSFKRDF